MTEILQQVHILQEGSANLEGQLQTQINYLLCMARKADGTQCSHRKKVGDYCGVHSNKPSINTYLSTINTR